MTIRLNLPKISYYYIQLKTGLTERLVILTESISSNLNFYVTKHKFWYIRCITAINTFWPYDNFRPYGIDYLVFWLLFIWPSDFGHLTPPYFNLNTSLFWQKWGEFLNEYVLSVFLEIWVKIVPTLRLKQFSKHFSFNFLYFKRFADTIEDL